MKTTFIYALKCPITGLIRYVGKSDNPKKRFPRHLHEAREGKTYHRAVWIRSLLEQKLKPLLEIIDEVADGVNEGLPLEAAYIQFFKDEGCDLTNATLGGESGPSLPGELNPNFGKSISPEQRAHLSEINTGEKSPRWGAKWTPERLAAFSGEGHPMFGHEHSPEAKEKIKAKRAVQIFTAERNAKISEFMSSEKHPMRGKHHTEETKEKIKAARVWQTVNSKTSGRLPKNCKISIGAF